MRAADEERSSREEGRVTETVSIFGRKEKEVKRPWLVFYSRKMGEPNLLSHLLDYVHWSLKGICRKLEETKRINRRKYIAVPINRAPAIPGDNLQGMMQ